MTDTAPDGTREDTQPVLQVRQMAKSFGPVQALQGVSFELHPGEVLGLLGDNGAGKSTLVNCLSGTIRPDAGTIWVRGQPVGIRDTHHARSLGLETVYQDLALVETLDVASNLFLNREIRTTPVLKHVGWMNRRKMYAETRRILDGLHIRVPSVTTPVAQLSGGQRQAVAVGRAAAWGRQIVLLDEPAAALGVEQSRNVLELVRRLAHSDVAVLFISHNMQHVIEVCDRAVVLRHGAKVGDVRIRDVSARDLVDLITGAKAG